MKMYGVETVAYDYNDEYYRDTQGYAIEYAIYTTKELAEKAALKANYKWIDGLNGDNFRDYAEQEYEMDFLCEVHSILGDLCEFDTFTEWRSKHYPFPSKLPTAIKKKLMALGVSLFNNTRVVELEVVK